MDDRMPPGPHSALARAQLGHPALPALPAHPEWREIVVPWGQKAPKVLQGKMVLPALQDPKDLSEQTVLPEFPECPVYLVKWARPEKPVRQALRAPMEHPARPERPAHRVIRDLPETLDRLVPLAPLAPKAPPPMPVLRDRPARRVPPDLPVKTALQAHQDHLAQMVNLAPPEMRDRLVQLAQRARAQLASMSTTPPPSGPMV